MHIANRLNHLSNTPLPDDLLKRLAAAKTIVSLEKKTAEVTAIEVECFNREIFIRYPYPAPQTNVILGTVIDSRI